MRRGTILAAVVIAYLGVVGPALAAPPDGAAGPWADYVVSANQGFANPVGGFLPNRSDPTAALGVAESPPGDELVIPTGSFFSLGFGGSLTLGFENPICNQAGADLAIEVREITKVPYPVERAQVYVSEDGITFLLAGTVSRDDTVPMPAGITVANFVRLVDANALADYAFDPNADGFDVDGVRALNTTCPTGKIEICKSASNGNTNRPYQFTLNGGAPFTVRGGRCSGPITTRPGLNTVVELQSTPPTDVSAISVRPSNRVISQDLPNRTAVVKVITGSTAASETKVTFTNQPAGGTTGDLKICKVSESPQYWGRQFSFRVNNGPLFSTEANPAFDPPGSWTCRLAGTFAVGSKVTVKEEIPTGAEVAFIDSDPADRLVDFDTNAGTATVTIGSGVTIVLYDNEPIPPARAGYIEVCKDAALVEGALRRESLQQNGYFEPDPYVKGPFTFTISPPDGSSFDVEVGVGQCTAPLLVAAGVVRVTEHAKANHTLVDVYTIPEDRLLASNLLNRTADVEVPASLNVNDESQVHFVNRRDRGQLKICKALGPGSEALSGERFEFWIAQLGDAALMNSVANWTEITALAGSTQCRIVGDYPVGNQVTVDESDPGEFVDVSGEVTEANPLTIAPGINTVTITNRAVGLLEICKAAVPDQRVQPTFRFRVDNGGIISIRAGTCKPPMRVAVGEHTIVEIAETYYELDPNAPGGGIVVTPPSREVSKNLALRTVRVRVEYGGDGETRVDFYNRVKRGQVKICKQVSPGSMDALGTRDFTYTYLVNGDQAPTPVGQSIRHGECVLITDPRTGGPREFPILQPGGQPTTVTIDEEQATFGSGIVVAFAYQGSGALSNENECSGTVTIEPLGAGMNHVTFINTQDNAVCVGG